MRYILLLFLLSGGLCAQATYRAGYLINNDGQRQEVAIYDRDWVDSPRSFTYRPEVGEGNRTGDLESVQEFGFVDGSRQFVRYTLDIDRSSDLDKNLSASAVPEYARETVFVDVLVDGQVDLFYWERGERKRFFYRRGEDAPRQLVSRRYRQGQDIRRDDSFRGVLGAQLKCPNVRAQQAQTLRYERRSLTDYVTAYNGCAGGATRVIERQPTAGRLSLGLRAGLERADLMVDIERVPGFGSTYDFTAQTTPRLGVDLEYRVPFAGNRWAVYTGAYYHAYRDQQTSRFNRTANIYYRAVNVPLGIRRYAYVMGRNSVFLNGQVSFEVPLNSNLTEVGTLLYNYGPTKSVGLEFGGGVSLSDRYQLEAITCRGRSLTENFTDAPSKYTYTALLMTYRIGGGR